MTHSGPSLTGRGHEFENVIGDKHINFTTSKTRSLVNVNQSCDTDLVKDLKCLVFSLIGLHLKIKPI